MLGETHRLQIGQLGTAEFAPGLYIYLGSAAGPGGLRARLGRHLRGSDKQHWHIDHLRAVGSVIGFCAVHDQDLDSASTPVECRWSQALAGRTDTFVPLPGFGSSDCKAGCPAHLVAITDANNASVARYRKILAAALGVSPDLIICRPNI